MRPNPVFPSLWRPVLWMGMERIPGALLILLTFLLVMMGLMLAGDYIATVLIVASATVGTVYLQRIAEQDPQFFKVWFRRLPRDTIYPARRTRIASTGRGGTERGGTRRVSVDASPVRGTGRKAAGKPPPPPSASPSASASARTPMNRLHALQRSAGRWVAMIEQSRKRGWRKPLRKPLRKPVRDPRRNGPEAGASPDPGTATLTESGKG